MSCDGDLGPGWSVQQLRNGPEPKSKAAGTAPLRDDVRAKYAVVVGKIVPEQQQQQPTLHRQHEQQHQQPHVPGGPTALQSDRVPSKPLRRSSSERSERETAAARQGSQTRPSFAATTLAAGTQDPGGGIQIDGPHHHRGRHHPPPPVFIEVAPGVELRLRGSDETWEAISRDFIAPGLCWGCSETVFVIQDAAYVLCPACKTVSPSEGGGTGERPEIAGVGLGFTFDELALWQRQIADERSRNINH